MLRDASTPLQTLALSDRASNLEDIERRLKLDILEEAKRYGGLILCHDEVTGGELVPTWVSVDESLIRTPKEVYDDIRSSGWRVDYWRIPVGPDRPIEVSLQARFNADIRTTTSTAMSRASRTLTRSQRRSSSTAAWVLFEVGNGVFPPLTQQQRLPWSLLSSSAARSTLTAGSRTPSPRRLTALGLPLYVF